MSGDDFTRALLAAGKREVADAGAKDRAFASVVASTADEERVVEARAVETGATEVRAARAIPFARLSAALAAALAIAAMSGGMYISKQADERKAAGALAAAQLADSQKQLDALNAQLAQQNQEVEAATAALANAKDESAMLAAQAQLQAAQNAVASTKKAFGGVRTSATKAAASAACTCSKMDPLCGCIP